MRRKRKRNSDEFTSRFETALEGLGLQERAGRIRNLFRDSLRLVTKPKGDGLQMLCETRIGGCPDLPKKVEWPVSSEGPLAFIAQLNLTEVPDFPAKKVLPRKGMLLFFYAPYSLQWGSDPAYIDRWRVMFFDDPHVNIASREFPSDLPEEYRYTPCGVHFRRQMTLPSLDSSFVEGLRLEGEQLDNYYDLLLAMDSIQGFDENESAHRIFGHPDQIRRNVFLDCLLGRNGFLEGDREMTDEEAKQLDDEVRNLRLLLQIDSDENAGMRFGNFGTLFFTLAADDLSKKKFGNTWLVFQQPRGKAQDSDQEDVT